MMETPKTPVMHKSAVPRDNIHKHTFMFHDSPGKSPGTRKSIQSAEDLVSVTVRKEDPSQKAGISLVERQDATYITKVDEHGLFHDTDIAEGDKVLSINGKRLKKGEGSKHILKTISRAKATVTLVVKKAGISPSRGSRGGKIKKRPNKIFQKEWHRNPDQSLDPNHDPRNLRQDEDDNDQVPIRAKKIYKDQPVGVSIVEYNDMIFVSGISLESPFRDSDLQLGDRVVGVNGMNFLNYPDAKLAKAIAEKSPKEVEFVIERGHEDLPEEIVKKMEETALLQSPSQNDDVQKELELDDIVTPVKKFNASLGGPLRTPTQREKELDRDVLQTPNLPFHNSFNVSSLSAYGTPRQYGSENSDTSLQSSVEVNSLDLADRVLSRQASAGKGDSLIGDGHYSWSHANQTHSPGAAGRKGKRKTTKPVKKVPEKADKPVSKKSSKLGLDDSSDESSLDEKIEKSLSSLKKRTNFHNSWSHPDHAKSLGRTVKKGKRRNLSTSSKTGKADKKALKPMLKPKPIPIKVEDTEESSLEDDLEAAVAEVLSPERKASYITSMSFNKSLSQIRPEDYEGDYIRIKVKKVSENNPGVWVKKIAGIFILSGLPPNEKRINTGSQVLAINGIMNINTVEKAESLMKQTKEYVTLMVDFSSPVDKRRVCPCCDEPIYANGEHVDEADNDDSGLVTARMNNHSGHGKEKNSVTSNYNLNEYMSETEDDDDDNESPSERPHTSKFHPGDKFMIRVKTKGNAGISLFDYKGNIYVKGIEKGGSLYCTPIDIGDKLISMNGKRAEVIKTASNAMEMLEEKENVNLYVCRTNKNSAEYKEALKRQR